MNFIICIKIGHRNFQFINVLFFKIVSKYLSKLLAIETLIPLFFETSEVLVISIRFIEKKHMFPFKE